MNKKFSVILKENDNIIYMKKDIICNFEKELYSFNENDIKTSFSFKKNFVFIRDSKDNTLEISIIDDIISSKMFVKDLGDYVNLPINMKSFNIDNSKIELIYMIESIERKLLIYKED